VPRDADPSPGADESPTEKSKRWVLFVVNLVTGVGGAVGAYLGVAAILMWPPFSGLPDVRIDLTASRVNAPGFDRAADEFICLVNKGDDAELPSAGPSVTPKAR
jgi:hypothetical protein